jgi:PadR family transcriptional regulator, regulatory protein PadR
MPERFTKQTLALLQVLLTDPTREWYGLELMELAGLSSGTTYPILHRLDSDGWLSAAPENVDPSHAGRPRRRLYKLTAMGERAALEALTARRAQSLARRTAPALGMPAGGMA